MSLVREIVGDIRFVHAGIYGRINTGMTPYAMTNEYVIYYMDCLDYLKSLEDESVPFVLTSPPYDNFRTYNGFTFDFQSIAKELARCLAPGGVIIWNVADQVKKGSKTCTSARQQLFFVDECGLDLHEHMIYHKSNPPPNGGRLCSAWENIFAFTKGKPRVFNAPRVKTIHPGHLAGAARYNKDGSKKTGKEANRVVGEIKITGNVFTYTIGRHSTATDGTRHPALMPERLAEDQILTWTNEGDTVLDPFSGAATTGKMALRNGRRYVGVEVNREFCDVSVERLNDVTAGGCLQFTDDRSPFP